MTRRAPSSPGRDPRTLATVRGDAAYRPAPLPGPAALAVLVLAACLSLTACVPGPLSRPPQERKFYTLQAKRPEAAAPSRDKTVLKVRPLRISPAYQGKEMVYRLGDSRYEQDYYNAFLVQPSLNMTQETRQWLGDSGLFGSVVDSTSQVTDTHLLEGAVNALYGDFRDRNAPKAVLEMQFFLLVNGKDSYTVAFSKSYRREAPFPAGFTDASGLAAAYDQALSGILSDLEADLRAAR